MRLLQSAAAGEKAASRILGAALVRIAMERGDLDQTTIARDAMRFGTNLPATVLPAIAAGGPIDPALLELARKAGSADPAAHQLIAHSDERRINDIDALTDALLEFSLAERLYRAEGETKQAVFVAHRRAQLARLLPDDRVLQVSGRRGRRWSPAAPEATTAPAPLVDLPTGASERPRWTRRTPEGLPSACRTRRSSTRCAPSWSAPASSTSKALIRKRRPIS